MHQKGTERQQATSDETVGLTKHWNGGFKGLSQKPVAHVRAVRRSHAMPLCRLT